MFRKYPANLLLLLFLFPLIYYQVFFAGYCYTDEIFQLWHNTDGSNYIMFTTQGRLFTGILFTKLFAMITAIDQIRYLRIFSLCGWIALTILWQAYFNKWARNMQLEKTTETAMCVFIICCIPVSMYIGWSACMEMFLGVAAGLISGHLAFTSFTEKEQSSITRLFFMVGSLIAGIASLFIYQNTFGLFLLPFFIYHTSRQSVKPGKTVFNGIFFYLFVYVVYYLLFKYFLSLEGSHQNSRVGISTDVAGKLSFFFSDPLPEAFSVNLLYSARSIFSQILAPLIMAGWMISVFIRYKNRKVHINLLYIIIILIFLALLYIPSMIAIENFASYRTLFAVNLAVFYLLFDQVLFFCKKSTVKKMVTWCVCIFLTITAFYNYNFQFVNPVKTEHKAFTAFMNKNMNAEINTIYFIRADRFLFSSLFNTRPYKDEFGVPSTSKDWVPEPLIKQYLFELTGNKIQANKIKVIQFETAKDFYNSNTQLSKNDLLLDMNEILPGYLSNKKIN